MTCKVLIAHAKGEEELAAKLAGPLRAAGYDEAHEGTVLVGESVVEEASKVLQLGGPVVLCATVRALGTAWARRVVASVRRHDGARVFIVQCEEDADVDLVSFDEKVARYWQDPAKALKDLLDARAAGDGPAPGPSQRRRASGCGRRVLVAARRHRAMAALA